jgi:hypothetical protein
MKRGHVEEILMTVQEVSTTNFLHLISFPQKKKKHLIS